MTAIADPTNSNSTHHIVLTHPAVSGSLGLALCDARGNLVDTGLQMRQIPDTALKIYSSDEPHSERKPPWKPVTQKDWSGGRGSLDFDKAEGRYYNGFGVFTGRPGEVILGGHPTTISNGVWESVLGANDTRSTLTMSSLMSDTYATSFVSGITTSGSTRVSLWFRPEIYGVLKLYLAADGGGHPAALSGGVDITSEGWTLGSFQEVEATIAVGLTAGTVYWLVAEFTPIGMYITFRNDVITKTSATRDQVILSGTDWVAIGKLPQWAFSIRQGGQKTGKAHWFEYKKAWFCAMQYDDETVSKVYINGDQGRVSSVSGTTITIGSGSATWSANEAVGSIIVLTKGPGHKAAKNWRVITANNATSSGSTQFTVDSEWDVAPTSATEVSIVCSNKMTEITGHGWAAGTQVVDVMVLNGAVYFAHDVTGAVITRLTRYNNAGTWTNNWSSATAPAETGKADQLILGSDQKGPFVLAINRGFSAKAYRADLSDSHDWSAGTGGSAMTFTPGASTKPVGDIYERITGAEVYDPYGNVYLIKEGSIYRMANGTPLRVGVAGLSSTRDYRNGQAHCVHGLYLCFSWHNSVARFYEANASVDRIGPDKDGIGNPDPRTEGTFVSLVSYADALLIGAVDAGPNGISTVLAYNGQGWFELYRAPYGRRISSLGIQPTPGNAVDRLWISVGDALVWLPLAIDPFRHPADTYNGFRYRFEGTLISPRYYVGMHDIMKLFGAIKVVLDEEGADGDVYVDYQRSLDLIPTDGPPDPFAPIGTTPIDFTTNQLALSSQYAMHGLWIQFRYRLRSGNPAETPRITATLLDTIVNMPVRNAYEVRFLIADDAVDIHGYPDPLLSAASKITAIRTMEADPRPAQADSVWRDIDGKYWKITGFSNNPIALTLDDGREAHVCSALLVEVSL